MRKWTDDRKLSTKEKDKKIIKYTQPKIKYEYSTITWDDYMRNKYDGYKTIRSSIIPIASINDKTHWLLGSFHDYPRYICMDFGGSCIIEEGREINRQFPFGCAINELHEESKGLLTQVILKNIGITDPNQLHIYVGKARRPETKVFFFFVPVDYEEIKSIIDIFNSTPDIDEKLGPIDFYSEEDIFTSKILTTHHLTDFIDNLTN